MASARRCGSALITRHSQQKSLRRGRGFSRTPNYELPFLSYFHENNHKREEHQGLDKRQAQNQRQLNSRTRRGIPPQRLARRRSHFALALRRETSRQSDGKP